MNRKDYINKAIMEEEAKNRCSNARFFGHSRFNDRFDCVENIGTCLRIEVV